MNDPRLTAYALGELNGPAREEFERELAASEDLQRALNETTKIAELLGKLPMSTETLPEKDRKTLRENVAKNLKISRHRIIKRRAVVAVALGTLAACLLIAPFSPWMVFHGSEPAGPDLDSAENGYVVSVKSELAPPVPSEPIVTLDTRRNAYDELDRRIAEETKHLSDGPLLSAGASGNPQQAPMSVTSMTTSPTLRGAKPKEEAMVRRQRSNSDGREYGYARGARLSQVLPERESFGPADTAARHPRSDFNTETYDFIEENVFLQTTENPLSTFSIDVDTASYSNLRRFLQNDQVPPAGAIRIEELINYFPYDYSQPEGDLPFSVDLEVSQAPWNARHELVRIGLQGREIPASERGPANLVFLVDVSGSMDEANKLPLLKRSLQALVENLSPRDRVALVVYAGSSGLVLPSTSGTEKSPILAALDNLQAGGATNGASGIQLAYDTARKHFIKEGSNRVILCTDGDFNVGTTNQSELLRLIEEERASGVFLSVLGFGTGNLKDSTMEKLADKGNGNYGYVDSFSEGRKILVEQMGATLFTIAKDVKIQVEFNPARVAGYRLIGYENRLLAKEDFNNDKKDAGEIGAGHNVTALYEIVPAGQPLPDQTSVDALKYAVTAAKNPTATDRAKPERPGFQSAIHNPQSEELLTLKLRYKAPDSDTSSLLEFPLSAPEIPAFAEASPDFRFAAAVAAFGMKLRGSPEAGSLNWEEIQKVVRASLGDDPGSYRAEFLTLIEKASRLSPADPGTQRE